MHAKASPDAGAVEPSLMKSGVELATCVAQGVVGSRPGLLAYARKLPAVGQPVDPANPTRTWFLTVSITTAYLPTKMLFDGFATAVLIKRVVAAPPGPKGQVPDGA